jgi:hypothetical protein
MSQRSPACSQARKATTTRETNNDMFWKVQIGHSRYFACGQYDDDGCDEHRIRRSRRQRSTRRWPRNVNNPRYARPSCRMRRTRSHLSTGRWRRDSSSTIGASASIEAGRVRLPRSSLRTNLNTRHPFMNPRRSRDAVRLTLRRCN